MLKGFGMLHGSSNVAGSGGDGKGPAVALARSAPALAVEPKIDAGVAQLRVQIEAMRLREEMAVLEHCEAERKAAADKAAREIHEAARKADAAKAAHEAAVRAEAAQVAAAARAEAERKAAADRAASEAAASAEAARVAAAASAAASRRAAALAELRFLNFGRAVALMAEFLDDAEIVTQAAFVLSQVGGLHAMNDFENAHGYNVLMTVVSSATVRNNAHVARHVAAVFARLATIGTGLCDLVIVGAPKALVALAGTPAVKASADAALHVAMAIHNVATWGILIDSRGKTDCAAAGAAAALKELAAQPLIASNAETTKWVSKALGKFK
jgi:hypothetical protein